MDATTKAMKPLPLDTARAALKLSRTRIGRWLAGMNDLEALSGCFIIAIDDARWTEILTAGRDQLTGSRWDRIGGNTLWHVPTGVAEQTFRCSVDVVPLGRIAVFVCDERQHRLLDILWSDWPRELRPATLQAEAKRLGIA